MLSNGFDYGHTLWNWYRIFTDLWIVFRRSFSKMTRYALGPAL